MKGETGGQQLSLLDLMMESQVEHLLSADEIFATDSSELFTRLLKGKVQRSIQRPWLTIFPLSGTAPQSRVA
jgi:hypothetical protein